jgi:HD superfamily phosphodiesterase
MTPPYIYDQIYRAAEPYWQTRSNEIHLPLAYDYARRLLAAYPEADESIVLPAILLHDIGYFNVPEETHLSGLAGAPKGWSPDVTRLHEVEGARLAGEILARLDYPPEKIALIQQIIDGHDSHPAAHSREDALVKDADKLWRYSAVAARICSAWNNQTPLEYLDFCESRIEKWLLTEKGRELAREELAQTRRVYAADGGKA